MLKAILAFLNQKRSYTLLSGVIKLTIKSWYPTESFLGRQLKQMDGCLDVMQSFPNMANLFLKYIKYKMF